MTLDAAFTHNHQRSSDFSHVKGPGSAPVGQQHLVPNSSRASTSAAAAADVIDLVSDEERTPVKNRGYVSSIKDQYAPLEIDDEDLAGGGLNWVEGN